jgi:hypothetical protein
MISLFYSFNMRDVHNLRMRQFDISSICLEETSLKDLCEIKSNSLLNSWQNEDYKE